MARIKSARCGPRRVSGNGFENREWCCFPAGRADIVRFSSEEPVFLRLIARYLSRGATYQIISINSSRSPPRFQKPRRGCGRTRGAAPPVVCLHMYNVMMEIGRIRLRDDNPARDPTQPSSSTTMMMMYNLPHRAAPPHTSWSSESLFDKRTHS